MDAIPDLHGLADPLTANARDLAAELDWFAAVLDARLKAYFGPETGVEPLAVAPPDLDRSTSPYALFLRRHGIDVPQRLVILLALIPHIRPQLLDVLLSSNPATQRAFSEFGGIAGTTHGAFVPTGETAVFLLAGDDLARRFAVGPLFDGDGILAREQVVQLGPSAGPSRLGGALHLSRQHLGQFTTGRDSRPAFDSEFPARRIETELGWQDLVLPAASLSQLEEARHWLTHGRTLLGDWQLGRRIAPGFLCLYHGPPGTGKTLSACLLGKYCGTDVYKIDLSMIVSKYIGETEKNLAKVFDLAERRGWILFFDEADALFGRRTKVDDAHDRFANQEISFLLQRIEEFDGLVILASNFKANIDDAFLRRFQSVVHFPMPRAVERLRLWREAFSPKTSLEPMIDLAHLADRHELSGGTIMNVARYASLMACSRGSTVIQVEDLDEGIRRELLKEGRVM